MLTVDSSLQIRHAISTIPIQSTSAQGLYDRQLRPRQAGYDLTGVDFPEETLLHIQIRQGFHLGGCRNPDHKAWQVRLARLAISD